LFNNLEAEIKRKQIHKEDIAIEIGKTYPTLHLHTKRLCLFMRGFSQSVISKHCFQKIER